MATRPTGKWWGVIGIYAITNKINNKKYIGQSTNIHIKMEYTIKAMYRLFRKEVRTLLIRVLKQISLMKIK